MVLYLLPHEFTLFSNNVLEGGIGKKVLLPYEFILFSNLLFELLVELAVLLPYEFTLFSNYFRYNKTDR